MLLKDRKQSGLMRYPASTVKALFLSKLAKNGRQKIIMYKNLKTNLQKRKKDILQSYNFIRCNNLHNLYISE